jgi:hypothetical protein
MNISIPIFKKFKTQIFNIKTVPQSVQRKKVKFSKKKKVPILAKDRFPFCHLLKFCIYCRTVDRALLSISFTIFQYRSSHLFIHLVK